MFIFSHGCTLGWLLALSIEIFPTINDIICSGECGEHFRGLLAKYPPQTSSRDIASQWGCFIHNQVNNRLGKLQFDCATIPEAYKCGCGEGEEGDVLKLPPEEDPLGPLPSYRKEEASDTKIKKTAEDGILEEATNPELKGIKLEIEG